MKYLDGTTINIGDKIWWNEGSNQGIVAYILEEEKHFTEWGLSLPGKESLEQLESYGISEKGIFICSNVHKKKLTPDVFYAEEDFEDEGIGPI